MSIKSESTATLFKALVKFRKAVKQPLKDADNPFFKSKYVPLESVVEVIDEAAAPLGISFVQEATSLDGMVGVSTTIFHDSGEYIEFEPLYLKPDKATPQGYGSAVTYARRYSLSTAFGITSDIDDDGNEASGNTKPNSVKPKYSNGGKEITEPTDTIEQRIEKGFQAILDKDSSTTKEKIIQLINSDGTDYEKLTGQQRLGKLLTIYKKMS